MSRLAAILAVIVLSACYTTRLVAPGPQAAEEHTARQWFALAGTLPLSGPAGSECAWGVSTATSEFTWTDGAIELGIGVVGEGLGLLACNATDRLGQGACAREIGLGAMLALEPMTVRYRCRTPGG